jgi:hypothetical protein
MLARPLGPLALSIGVVVASLGRVFFHRIQFRPFPLCAGSNFSPPKRAMNFSASAASAKHLSPHWMKARPEIQPINARAETVAEKRMFADAYAKRRCIVPMDVFYERDKRKKLHAFAMTDGTPFGVAGIWENWRNQNGEWERTFCIITVPATNWSGRSTTACRPSFRSRSTRAGSALSPIRAICCGRFPPHS